MIESAIIRFIQWFQNEAIPEIQNLLIAIKNINPFENSSPEELQIECIIIALEALFLVMILRARKNIVRKRKDKNAQKTAPQFQPKIWSPSGWYWDDQKGKWIAPDYKDKE